VYFVVTKKDKIMPTQPFAINTAYLFEKLY